MNRLRGELCFGSWFQRVQSMVTSPFPGPLVKSIIMAEKACGGGVSSWGQEEEEELKARCIPKDVSPKPTSSL